MVSCEALVVLYQAMRAESHRRIRMVFKMASEPRELLFHCQLETKAIQLGGPAINSLTPMDL